MRVASKVVIFAAVTFAAYSKRVMFSTGLSDLYQQIEYGNICCMFQAEIESRAVGGYLSLFFLSFFLSGESDLLSGESDLCMNESCHT